VVVVRRDPIITLSRQIAGMRKWRVGLCFPFHKRFFDATRLYRRIYGKRKAECGNGNLGALAMDLLSLRTIVL
jgi:hypothetical protein